MKKDIIILTACVSVISGIIVCTRSPAKAETTNNNLIMIEKNISKKERFNSFFFFHT